LFWFVMISSIIYGLGITERHTMFLHSRSLKSTL
jgi:hypothetical protein